MRWEPTTAELGSSNFRLYQVVGCGDYLKLRTARHEQEQRRLDSVFRQCLSAIG